METAAVPKKKRKPPISSSTGDRLFVICNYCFMIALMIVTLYPFVNVLAVSLNNAQDSIKGGIYLLPREWTLANYNYILREATIFHATFHLGAAHCDRNGSHRLLLGHAGLHA